MKEPIDTLSSFIEQYEDNLKPVNAETPAVERDIKSEVENLRNQPPRLPANQLKSHANREIIKQPVGVERHGKHIEISTDRRTTLIKSDDSWTSRSPISVTTTQAEELTYVILSGECFQSMQDESDRYIFSNSEIAETFKSDLLKAVTSTAFWKSDHLVVESDLIVQDARVEKEESKKLKDWLNYLGYGLTTCAIFLVGAIAVGYGWRLAESWF